MAKINYSTEENTLRATLRKIKYKGQPTRRTIEKYYSENKEVIDNIETVQKYPSQRAVLLSFFKKEFESGEHVRNYDLPDKFETNDQQTLKSIKKSCGRLTRTIRKNRSFVLDTNPWFMEKFSIFIIYILQQSARLGNKKKIKINDKDISEISAVYLDKENKILKTINIPEKLNMLFETLLQNEMGIQLFKPTMPKTGSWKTMSDSLIRNEISVKIEEIGFNLTDVSSGEKIIIKSNKGDARQYLKTLIDQNFGGFIDPDRFDLSYVEYVKLRFDGGHTNFLKFERENLNASKKGENKKENLGALTIKNKSKYKDKKLEKQLFDLGLPINQPIIDSSIISFPNLLQQIIVRGFLSKEESELDIYKDMMKKLESYGIVKGIKELRLYKCYGSPKCWGSSAFRTKVCPHCHKSNKILGWCQGYDIEFDITEIEKQLRKKATRLALKYRKLKTSFYNGKYVLRKLSIPNTSEVNIYFNRKGLYQDILKDFSLCPRALYCINFSGQIKKCPEFIFQEDASNFILRLFGDNDSELTKFLTENIVNKSLGEVKENAFNQSVAELKKIKQSNLPLEKNKGSKYEYLTSNIFNYIFQISDKWGGKNLPDGIIGFESNGKRKFAFWDAKRYDTTKLSQYAKKKRIGVVKDVQYVLESLKKEDSYDDGSLDYYIFVTSSTDQKDFIKIRSIITTLIEKNKYSFVKRKKISNPFYYRLKDVKFCCINLNELIEFASIFSDKTKRDKLLRSIQFGPAFENILDSNDGYVDKVKINSELSSITDKEEFTPDKEAHEKQELELLE